MSKRSDVLKEVELLQNDLNTEVSHKISLSEIHLLELSQRIDDLVIRLIKTN